MEWRPIESAPRDGTDIDVWIYCHDPEWRGPSETGIENGMRETDVFWEDGYWKKIEDGDSYSIANEHYTISHWMPLPEPPAMGMWLSRTMPISGRAL